MVIERKKIETIFRLISFHRFYSFLSGRPFIVEHDDSTDNDQFSHRLNVSLILCPSIFFFFRFFVCTQFNDIVKS